MGQAARAMVLEHYTTLTMQTATLAVYDDILGTCLAEQFALHVAEAQWQAEAEKNASPLLHPTAVAG